MDKSKINMTNNVVTEEEYKLRINLLFDDVSNTLSKTLGPYGATSVLDKVGDVMLSKDGWQVLKKLAYMDEIQNTLLGLIVKIAHQVVMRVGPRQKIIPLEFRGAQILAGGKKEIDDYRRRVGHHDEIHHLLERRNVVYQRVDVHSDQIDEPEKIGDQEQLAKGDRVVEGAMDRIIPLGAVDLFHKEEEKSVDRPIEEQPQVTGLIGAERSENESSKVKLGF